MGCIPPTTVHIDIFIWPILFSGISYESAVDKTCVCLSLSYNILFLVSELLGTRAKRGE